MDGAVVPGAAADPQRSSSRRRSQPAGSPQAQADQAALKRAAILLVVGCVAIAVGVGVAMGQPTAAVGGCIGWIVVMVIGFRNDRSGVRR